MECLVLILGLIAIILLYSIFSNLNQIRKETKAMSNKQAEFNSKVDAINAGLETLTSALTSEASQIRDAIAGEAIDITALDGVATRLAGLAETVNNLVVAPVEVEEEETPADAAADDTATDEGNTEGDGE